MGSTKYVYVGPYLRIHRVLREVSIFANPHCCGSSYRGAEKFCPQCGEALRAGTCKQIENAVDVLELQCGKSIQEALVCQTSQGRDIHSECDLWTPNGCINAVALPETDKESEFECSAEHIREAKRAFAKAFTREIAAVNAAYIAAGGKAGLITYGVITYWM